MPEQSRPDLSSNRAGRYVQQPTGYRAFIPASLPPTPPLHIDDSMAKLLSAADRALGRLDGSFQTFPNPDFFVYMYVRQEAVLSSQIEGTQSSLQDVLAAEAEILDPDRPRDVAEVLNYIRAMRRGLARLETLPISVRLIREIHAELLTGVRGSHLLPGDIRTSQNWIGGTSPSNAAFVPPPPVALPDALSNLEAFLHSEDDLPVLFKIAIAHAQFETIHPFLDGNGRIGRLLITFLLCEQEVLEQPVLYLSAFFRRNRIEYYDRLQAVRDAGDWEGWVRFFLLGVLEVANEAVDTSRRLQTLREDHRAIVMDQFGRATANGLRVLDRLYSHPIVSVEDVRVATGTTYAASNLLVNRFVDIGILREFTGQKRNRRFIFDSYLQALDPTFHVRNDLSTVENRSS